MPDEKGNSHFAGSRQETRAKIQELVFSQNGTVPPLSSIRRDTHTLLNHWHSVLVFVSRFPAQYHWRSFLRGRGDFTCP